MKNILTSALVVFSLIAATQDCTTESAFKIQVYGKLPRKGHKEPIAANFLSDIMKAIDFSLLKNMLGK